jgi:hypothetical protein
MAGAGEMMCAIASCLSGINSLNYAPASQNIAQLGTIDE